MRESQLQQKRQDQVCSVDLGLSASALCTPMQTSFSIFDELLPETQPTRLPVPGARCPLASFSKPQETIPSKEAMPEALDDLAGIEPLNEEAIVTEHKDKTLFPNPEDTCDFIRAAHVVSTPFHGVTTQDEPDPDSDSTIKETQRQPLSERTPDCKEPSCTQAFSVKKLSPILEMSQEGTHSSVSSGSSVSSAVNTLIEVTKIPGEVISASRTLAGVANTTGINEDTAGDVCSVKCCVQLHRQLLQPFQDLFSSSANFYQEAVPMPRIQEQVDVKLGFESYYIEKEVVLDEDNKIYLGVSMDATTKAVKRVAIKVDSQPDPWDFYIHLQLKERLGVEFQEEFEKCSCFLYQDGYVMLYREMTCNSILGIIGDVTLSQNVVMVLAYHLLRLVEKLHTAEIIHGNLYPQTLFLVDGIPEILACDKNTSILKLVDFSHSVDMKLQPSASLSDFPVAETEQAQQILSEQSSPYQVDLLGIAQIVHLLLHGEHLQVHQEDYKWKLNQTVPKYASSELWARFFERILNTEGASTVSVLRELGEEMKPPGSAFQDPEYFFLMSLHLHTV